MVLINLSSNGELDPAKFSNYFSQGLTIEKNSYLCLVNGSVVENLANNYILIKAGTEMTVRFDPLNQSTKIITEVNKEFILSELVTVLNDKFADEHNSIGFNCRFTVDPVNNDLGVIHFELFNRLNDGIGEQQLLWGVNSAFQTSWDNQDYDSQQYFNWITQPSTKEWEVAGVKQMDRAITKTHSNNLQHITFTSAAAPDGKDSYCMIKGNPTYTLEGKDYDFSLTNNHNAESPQVLLQSPIGYPSPNPDPINYTFTQFTIACNANKTGNSADAVYHVTAGPSAFDFFGNVFNNITTSVKGGATYYDIGFKGDGTTELKIYNVEQNDRDDIALSNYFFGDVYRLGATHSTDTTTLNPEFANCPNILKISYDGLVYWLPNSQAYTGAGSTARNYNTRTIQYNPGPNFLYKSTNNTTPLDLWDRDWETSATELKANGGYMGCWGGQGYQNSTRDNNAEPMFLDNGQNLAMNLLSDVGVTYSDFVSNIPTFFRCDVFTPEHPTPNATFKQRLELNMEQGKLLTEYPCLISFLVKFYDDSAIMNGPAQHNMTVISGIQTIGATEAPVFQFHLLQNQVMDVTVFDDNSAPIPLVLTDSVGTRLNMDYGKYYQFLYKDDGEGNFVVSMFDLDDDYTEYSHIPSLHASGRLMNPYIIGGTNDPTVNQGFYFMSGNVADFRMYAKPRTGAQTVANLWDNVVAGFESYNLQKTQWDNIITGTPNKTTEFGAPAQKKYMCLPDTNINVNIAYVFNTGGLTNDNFSINPDFTDIYVPLDINMAHDSFDNDIPLKAITDYGNGLTEIAEFQAQIEFEDYDGINERVITHYTKSGAVGVNNPFFNEEAKVANISLNDEVYNVEITNLPHISYNGSNKTTDKTIYQLPIETQAKVTHNLKITEHSPASKVWIPLRNAGEIPINKLDVQISREDGTKALGLQPDTHISIQIEKREDIFN